MKKLYYPIDTCNECHWFDNDYHGHTEYHARHYCSKLEIQIIMNESGEYPIPDSCPLENWEEDK